jgi:hypothetical protein
MYFRSWNITRHFVTALLFIAGTAIWMPTHAQDIPVGTWELVKRTLPDGKVISAPAIHGYFSTKADGTYHLNVFWQTPEGKMRSRSSIVQNKFSENALTATMLAGSFDDGSGKPVYDAPGTKTVPIKREGNKISYQHPFDPPSIVWEGDTLVATFENGPVDTWERVK